MNYATGQMASIMRLVPTDPAAAPRTVRAVPVLQRAAWRPWPQRLWGWPRALYGWPNAAYYFPPEGIEPGFRQDIVGAAPPDVHAAAQALSDAIHAGAARSQPPAWRPTVDFQRAFNHSFGPLGGLGVPNAPELLKLDGIYGPRTELALGRVLGGGISHLMALYGPSPDGAAAGQAAEDVSQLLLRMRVNIDQGNAAVDAVRPADAVRFFRHAGAIGATQVGPTLDQLTGGQSQGLTHQAWTRNADLAAVAATASMTDAVRAQSIARWMLSAYEAAARGANLVAGQMEIVGPSIHRYRASGGQLEIVGPSIHRYRASGSGNVELLNPSPHQYDILGGTSIDPQLASAVQQLGTVLMGHPGVVGIADNAARGGIDVFSLPAFLASIQNYVDNVLLGNFMGFPVAVRLSAGHELQSPRG
jgi:hypothetical protein